MSTHRTLLSSFSMLVIITMLFSGLSLPSASAQGPDGIERQLNPQTGKVSFISPADGQALPAADMFGGSLPPQDPAMALAKRYGPEFGLKDPGRDLQEFASDRAEDGRLTVRYQQNYQGIPVIGGELIVNTNDNGDLYSLNGEVSSNLSLSTQPTIGAETARETALLAVAKWYQKSVQDFLASEPELWIYDESLLQPSKRPAELVWRMEVTPKAASMPVRELVLVNAQQGGISLHFNQVDTAWTSSSSDKTKDLLISPTCSIQNGPGTGNLLFKPYVNYQCGLNGYGVGAGDFNGDGRQDVALSVATGIGFQHTLLVFLQNDIGNLAQPISYPAGERSEYLAVGDLNTDGRDDIVIVDGTDGTISVYRQNGSGTLNNRVTYSTDTGPDSIVIDDINSDGLDDIVISHWNSPTIGVFTQNGDGTLNSMVTYASVAAGYDDIAIGDVNGDGLNDVVKMNGQGLTNTLLVYTQNNTHTLNPYFSISNCSYYCGGNGIEVGDVTGDGRDDIVLSLGGNGSSAKVAVYPQDLNGNLQTPIIYSSRDIPDPVEIADMDSDGALDVIVLHSGWTTAGIYSQQINRTLAAESLYSIPYKSWYYSQDLSIGDVNNDGLSDILIADGTGLVVLYRRSPVPNTLFIESGDNQVAALQAQFSQPLKVKIKDFLDQPVIGVTVTFTAPSSGSSAVFEDTGTNTTTAVTDSNGIATVTLSANDVTGMYTVTASVDGLASSVDFQLTNVDATIPSSISIVSGSNQSAALQTQFLQLLKVKIRNGLNQPLSGKTVTFTAPATGASGTFANTHTRISTAVTDANGIATASAFTANNVRGSYVVVATVAGLETSANFQLFNGTPIVKTYTANNGISLPGTFLCDQTKPSCTNNVNPHADAAHRYAMGTNTLYANQHGRDSIDNRGMAIISTVHFYSGYANAFWTGAQMVYGDAYGFPLADDVVAHELTHGVTQYESNLFYYYQSGAINESFSDLWGEYYDQTNGKGNDDASVKWLMGEDVSGWGAIRSMSDPTWFGDPDKMSSGYYYEDDGDNGGVHSNSGINNKAAYLMVDGGSFNGKTVTALGWTKTAAIYYEANSKLLSSGADYSDLYYALQKACSNLVGQKGMTTANCVEVKDAVDAVEMNGQPAPNFNTDAPLCAAGTVLNVVFADDLENGTGKWAFANGAYPRWQLDSLYGPYAQSGNHSLYADDSPDTITDATARLTPLTIPPNAFLNFAHAYGFETGYYSGILQNFDGGVLEYSINGGATWVDAGSLINFNGYKGAIFTGAGNPLSGRSAFVGSSHGYIGTRLNLASLAGKSVSFRWRMGLDEAASNWGWWVDNIKVYTCIPVPGAFNKTTPSNGGTNVALSTTLSWNSSPYATSYQYCYDVIDDNKCNRTWGTIANTSAPISSLGANTTYFWQVRASNQVATTEADNQSWGSFTTTSTLPAGTADLETSIRGTLQGKYSLGSGLSLRESYTGVNNGPVMMRSANGIPMIAAERMIYKANGVDTSFSEMMGMPASQLDTTYWLPWYNNKDLNTQLRIANVSDTDAVIHVSIGGTPVDGSPYTLTPGASKRLSFPGIDRGPVKIESNVNIVAAERVIYKVNGLNTSYSEMMALPNKQLDTTYWLPWYNSKNLNTQLRIANVSDTDATVNVSIGGTPVDGSPFLIPVGASKRLSFPGIDKGPVKIESDVNIVAAERVIYRVNGVDTSFSEMMAVPAGQLDTFYWLPWYNNKSASIDTQLRFANVSDQPATVYVTIGGIEVADSPFTLTPGASTRRSFAGIDKGPVKIESDVPIVVAERVIYKAPGNIPTSFSEMTGLPDHLLDTAYWLPWYNNVELNTQLRFGVP